jgi:CBS domain containing-hemolysin-like protein
VALLVANGFFVGAEFAVIAARRTKIDGLAAAGDFRAKLAQRSIKELSLMLAGVQLGITMASLGLGAVAEPAVAHLIENGIHSVADLPSGLLHSISFVIALTIVVFFHMVIGEMAPKNVAIAEPEKTALWLAVPLRVYAFVFRPFIRLLNAIANVGTRLFGVEPQEERTEVHTAGELRAMIADSAKEGMVDAFEHRLLSGAIGFGTRDAASIMVPRTEMVAVASTVTPAELERLVLGSGHSRFPVYAGDLDNVVGFVHSKDLLKMPVEGRDRPIERTWIRQMLVVPESLRLHPLLVNMRRERHQFALVVGDRHAGGPARGARRRDPRRVRLLRSRRREAQRPPVSRAGELSDLRGRGTLGRRSAPGRLRDRRRLHHGAAGPHPEAPRRRRARGLAAVGAGHAPPSRSAGADRARRAG